MIIQTSTPQQIISLDQEKKKGIVLIWFYATWCGHCIDMEGEWDKLRKKSPKGLNLAKIESSNMDNYRKSPGEEELRGYPTLRLYSKGDLIKEYDGERSYEGIYNFADDYLKKHNNVKKNNLLMVKARRGNKINKNLIKKIISNKKGTNKIKKKTVKNNKTNNKTKKKKSVSKKKKSVPKKKRRQAGGHAKHSIKVEI
jgi:thiol-disulfide isomerase/thioredoxin